MGRVIALPELITLRPAFRSGGKTVVFTGELQSFSRSEAEKKVRALGGNATGSVSEKTDFVVVGREPGSKFTKAKKLGVKILTEKQFIRQFADKQN